MIEDRLNLFPHRDRLWVGRAVEPSEGWLFFGFSGYSWTSVWYANISPKDVCARPALGRSGYSAADKEWSILSSFSIHFASLREAMTQRKINKILKFEHFLIMIAKIIFIFRNTQQPSLGVLVWECPAGTSPRIPCTLCTGMQIQGFLSTCLPW